MPTVTGKDGKPRFSMNPQVGKAMSGGTAPGMPPTDPNATQTPQEDHVELHHGGHPQGDPPPSETTKYHTIANHSDGSADVKNHDDYDTADQHMKQVMGEAMDGDMGISDNVDMDMGSDTGDE